MRLPTPLLAAGLAALLASARPGLAQPSTGADSWRAILDGSTTAGWAMVGPGQLKPEGDALVTEGGMGLFWYTKEKLADCQVRVVFRLSSAKDNSGVFIRIPDPPTTPWDAVHKGYEVQIDNTGDDWHRTGVLYSLTRAKASVSPKVGEWATMIITLDGKRTRVEVDGALVTDFTEGDPVPDKKQPYEPDRGPRPEAGYIGLQNHDEHARVVFKEISVRPLR